MPATSQFTPQQILDAARRAEADNNIVYALQFYRHLAEQHHDIPESLLAREALNRLTRPHVPALTPSALTRVESAQPPQAPPMMAANGHPGGRIIPMPPATQIVRQAQAHQAPLAARPPIGPDHHGPRPSRAPSSPVRHYKFGRALGALLGISGWIGAIAAVVALIAPLLTVFGAIKSLPSALPNVSMSVSIALLATSLIFVLLSQIARASFDAADAARHASHIDE